MGKTKRLISQLSSNTLYLSLLAVIGFCLSFYALYVELKFESDHNYRAYCDISSIISCTDVFSSKYGRGLGLFPKDSPLSIPNSIFGLLLYFAQLTLANIAHANVFITQILIVSLVLSNIATVYLSYVLAFILRELCLVCVSTYFVNFLMLCLAYSRYKLLTSFKSLKND